MKAKLATLIALAALIMPAYADTNVTRTISQTGDNTYLVELDIDVDYSIYPSLNVTYLGIEDNLIYGTEASNITCLGQYNNYKGRRVEYFFWNLFGRPVVSQTCSYVLTVPDDGIYRVSGRLFDPTTWNPDKHTHEGRTIQGDTIITTPSNAGLGWRKGVLTLIEAIEVINMQRA